MAICCTLPVGYIGMDETETHLQWNELEADRCIAPLSKRRKSIWPTTNEQNLLQNYGVILKEIEPLCSFSTTKFTSCINCNDVAFFHRNILETQRRDRHLYLGTKSLVAMADKKWPQSMVIFVLVLLHG